MSWFSGERGELPGVTLGYSEHSELSLLLSAPFDLVSDIVFDKCVCLSPRPSADVILGLVNIISERDVVASDTTGCSNSFFIKKFAMFCFGFGFGCILFVLFGFSFGIFFLGLSLEVGGLKTTIFVGFCLF